MYIAPTHPLQEIGENPPKRQHDQMTSAALRPKSLGNHPEERTCSRQYNGLSKIHRPTPTKPSVLFWAQASRLLSLRLCGRRHRADWLARWSIRGHQHSLSRPTKFAHRAQNAPLACMASGGNYHTPVARSCLSLAPCGNETGRRCVFSPSSPNLETKTWPTITHLARHRVTTPKIPKRPVHLVRPTRALTHIFTPIPPARSAVPTTQPISLAALSLHLCWPSSCSVVLAAIQRPPQARHQQGKQERLTVHPVRPQPALRLQAILCLTQRRRPLRRHHQQPAAKLARPQHQNQHQNQNRPPHRLTDTGKRPYSFEPTQAGRPLTPGLSMSGHDARPRKACPC